MADLQHAQRLGGALAGQRKRAEAEPLLVGGYEGLRQRNAQIPPASRIRLQEARERLAQFYADDGQPEKAAALRENKP